MHQQLRRAEPFIIGCPACMSNFRNLFCSLFCSPDQATFTNITQVQQGSRKESRGVNHTVVEEVSFYLSDEFKNDTYNSCKDVIFGSANSRAMTYIGNNAHKAQVCTQADLKPTCGVCRKVGETVPLQSRLFPLVCI